MWALSMLIGLQATYGPPNIPAPDIGQPVVDKDCPIPNGNEIVVCKAKAGPSIYRYKDMGPIPTTNALNGPVVIRLPGGVAIQGFAITIPF
jgi:hypothetical protein